MRPSVAGSWRGTEVHSEHDKLSLGICNSVSGNAWRLGFKAARLNRSRFLAVRNPSPSLALPGFEDPQDRADAA